MIKIEIWSDIACPFCYIGKRRLEETLSAFKHGEEVEVTYRSFLLAPDAPKDNEKDIHAIIGEKYGLPYELAKANNLQITSQARAAGLEFNFDQLVPTNTTDAHCLLHFAKEHGKMNELKERLLKAYFTDGLHIGEHEILVKLAGEVGLNEEEAKIVLEEGTYKDSVEADLAQARKYGITSVPFYVFNGKYAVSGAQPMNAIQEVIQKVWEEEQQPSFKIITPPPAKNQEANSCDDEGCKI